MHVTPSSRSATRRCCSQPPTCLLHLTRVPFLAALHKALQGIHVACVVQWCVSERCVTGCPRPKSNHVTCPTSLPVETNTQFAGNTSLAIMRARSMLATLAAACLMVGPSLVRFACSKRTLAPFGWPFAASGVAVARCMPCAQAIVFDESRLAALRAKLAQTPTFLCTASFAAVGYKLCTLRAHMPAANRHTKCCTPLLHAHPSSASACSCALSHLRALAWCRLRQTSRL